MERILLKIEKTYFKCIRKIKKEKDCKDFKLKKKKNHLSSKKCISNIY